MKPLWIELRFAVYPCSVYPAHLEHLNLAATLLIFAQTKIAKVQ